MKGNFHVRFLGGCGRATARTYPMNSTSFFPCPSNLTPSRTNREGMACATPPVIAARPITLTLLT